MTEVTGKGRALKKQILDLLSSEAFEEALEKLRTLPGRQAVNPLFSFLLHKEELIRWRAVTAMGVVAEELARGDMEGMRTVMRRLMWSLNEESGGIGWGAPESMAEIMACHEGLAREYGNVFVSYFEEQGNYLEHEVLQRGLLWGLVRLAGARPDVVRAVGPRIADYLKSEDAAVRGLAAQAAGILAVQEARDDLVPLLDDDRAFTSYVDRRLVRVRVNELARTALARITSDESS